MASVWGELKRRNVVKVALPYAIVGWLLIAETSAALPTQQCPEWAVTFVSLVFPLAVFRLWIYEFATEGMKPTNLISLV